jgi:16S rRNA (cytosine1407-C5)-methyltransferase
VNTLKCSVKDFQVWAKERGWILTPVAWCPEGFFVERENREAALGRDLRHLLGHFYMQEAASMLPVGLLDPQPGEVVLDLCAAPGSKATQMAARMAYHPEPVEGRHAIPNVMVRRAHHDTFGVARGIVVANDMQEKRLRVLNDALQRTGATNMVIVRRVGQWYGKHMTERFDRVLCDAPCTAQGTCRKDPSALHYCSEASIAKAAKLQRELLEAAVHAAKVGGRIVYSTCTLTPEENEEIVLALLGKFCDRLEVLDPREILDSGAKWDIERAIVDSAIVQKSLCLGPNPFLRLWPQTYDTEGFFCAVLRKVKPTRPVERMEGIRRQAELLPRAKQQALLGGLQGDYGTDFLKEDDALILRSQQVLLTTEEVLNFPLPTTEYACGVPFAKVLPDGRFRLANDLVALRGGMAEKGILELTEIDCSRLLSGKDISCRSHLRGDIVLRYRGIAVGLSLAKDGFLLNRLPRWVVKLGNLEQSAFDPEPVEG